VYRYIKLITINKAVATNMLFTRLFIVEIG
jgi:hypothetical protein